MRVRDWQEILGEVSETTADPDDWRAVVGNRRGGLGEDLFLAHPGMGVYQLKTFAKNPFDVRGVGTRVATSMDDDLAAHFPDLNDPVRFAINRPPDDPNEAAERAKSVEATVDAHRTAPTTPEDLFTDLMDALESPAHGPLELSEGDRPPGLEGLQETFQEPDSILEDELEELIDRTGVGHGIH